MNEMKIEKLELEESKVNKGCMIVVAITDAGDKFVLSGDHYSPTYAIPYENSFDTKELKK